MNAKQIVIALRMTLVTLVLTGIAYPLAITGAAQLLFPNQANGSLLPREGRSVGSELLAQGFTNPAYVQPRPSAAGYDAANSTGSNLGPTSQKLRDRVAAEIARLKGENPDAGGPVPLELVTTSASGLDPHLSPEAASWQAPRIAAARAVEVARVQAILAHNLEGRTLGILGEPRVNVLRVNLALDHELGTPARNP